MKLREEIGTLSHTAAVVASPGGIHQTHTPPPVGGLPGDLQTNGQTDGLTDGWEGLSSVQEEKRPADPAVL